MGNGYAVPPQDALDQLRQILQDARVRLRELEAIDGTQINDTVQTLKNIVDGLVAATEINVTGNITSSAGNITATVGDVTAGDKLFAGNWYNNNITGSGGYHVAYVSIAGEAGYVPSSIAFKQDVRPADIDPEAVLGVDVVRFRYKDAVENLGDEAAEEVGVIAEQVADLGMNWLLDTTPDGTPVGFKYERLALAILPALQSLAARVTALEG